MSFKASFAFFGTTYNNAKTADLTLNSIVNVIDLLPEIRFEVAVVDNYSFGMDHLKNSSITGEFSSKGAMLNRLRF